MVVRSWIKNKRVKFEGVTLSTCEQAILMKGMNPMRFDGHRINDRYANYRRTLVHHMEFFAEKENTTVDKVIARMIRKGLLKIEEKGDSPSTDSIVVTEKGRKVKGAFKRYVETRWQELHNDKDWILH